MKIISNARAKGERPDLNGANLRDANLSDANLSGADLSGANLSCADLREAKYSHKDINAKRFTVILNLYKYTVIPMIAENGEHWIAQGCKFQTRKDWETNFWNNTSEFPDDGSESTESRKFALATACAWLAGKLSEQTYLWDAEDLRAELDESGAWDDEELSDHEENIERMIWIACGDVAENPDYYLD